MPGSALSITHARPLLLVDDSQDDVDLTLRALRRVALAHPVQVARDGDEVPALMRGWESGDPWPVLILMDIRMPRRGGLDALAELKAHHALRAIPVIVLTTSRAQRDVAAAYAAGANSYLVKPVDYDAFRILIERVTTYWLDTNEHAIQSAAQPRVHAQTEGVS